eukprot:m.332520 g.332520  ORF g.332520 m.332520 type:complete len:518 (-) comp16060_c2_seq1:180-1733(-)
MNDLLTPPVDLSYLSDDDESSTSGMMSIPELPQFPCLTSPPINHALKDLRMASTTGSSASLVAHSGADPADFINLVAAELAPPRTKATIRVPTEAARFLLSSPSALTAFQSACDVEYLACCSNMATDTNITELLLRGTGDCVKHATATLEQIGGKLAVPKPQRRLSSSHRSASTQSLQQPTVPGQRQAYVFVDNSNIFVGAQLDRNVRDLSVRVNIRAMADIIEEGLPCAYRAVSGTSPSSGRIWHEWENNNYNTFIDRGNGGDAEIRSAISEQLEKGGRGQILVLATGDGNDAPGTLESYPTLTERALENEWEVRIWSWQQSLSRKFKELKAKYGERLQLLFLDSFKDKITFKAGQASPETQPRRRASIAVDRLPSQSSFDSFNTHAEPFYPTHVQQPHHHQHMAQQHYSPQAQQRQYHAHSRMSRTHRHSVDAGLFAPHHLASAAFQRSDSSASMASNASGRGMYSPPSANATFQRVPSPPSQLSRNQSFHDIPSMSPSNSHWKPEAADFAPVPW